MNLNLDAPKKIDNAGVSDLWFNHDHSNYQPDSAKGRDDYDLPAMLEEAESFSITLQAAGITDAPSASELVEDFFARL